MPSGQECVVARSATKPGGLGACPHSRKPRSQMRSEDPICDIKDPRSVSIATVGGTPLVKLARILSSGMIYDRGLVSQAHSSPRCCSTTSPRLGEDGCGRAAPAAPIGCGLHPRQLLFIPPCLHRRRGPGPARSPPPSPRRGPCQPVRLAHNQKYSRNFPEPLLVLPRACHCSYAIDTLV